MILKTHANKGILPIRKEKGKTSFSLVSTLRRLTQIRKIGHAGTLDPFADGVMILLIGKEFTKLSNQFLNQDKEYLAEITLGIETDTFDIDGTIISQNPLIPSLEQVQSALSSFQGTFLQIPPMFSAKKVGGKKLYELARKGITIERQAVKVNAHTEFIDYHYPKVQLKIACSKGTYIRSIASELGKLLSCGAHLSSLTRTRSGNFTLENCCDGAKLMIPDYEWMNYLQYQVAAL